MPCVFMADCVLVLGTGEESIVITESPSGVVSSSCNLKVALRALYSRKMISCKWPSSVCVESHFGQEWKKRTLCPIKTLNLTKVVAQNKKHKRVKPLGWTWAFHSPSLDIRLDWLRWKSFFQLPPPPRVPSSAACNSICSPFCFGPHLYWANLFYQN